MIRESNIRRLSHISLEGEDRIRIEILVFSFLYKMLVTRDCMCSKYSLSRKKEDIQYFYNVEDDLSPDILYMFL